jgi:hypothetical protein
MCYSTAAEDPCSDSQQAPILAEQRVEYEQLQSELAQLASQLADTQIAAMEKVNKQKDMFTKNNQIFRQQTGALGAENTQLKSPSRLPRG